MAVNNYGFMHMPKIVRFAGGKARSAMTLPALDSASLYLGGFVPLIAGTAGADGIEFGVPAFADDGIIGGFIIGMHRKGSNVPLWDDELRAGTVTNATGELPVKYAFSASNDESNTTSAILEQVDIMPIMPGDILEVALFGASTASVARGTTTAAGTTTSSANIGVSMAVAGTYDFALLESGASKTTANQDFMTVEVDGKKPANPNHVYVMCTRKASSYTVAV
jgi:hypothetical protein